MRAIDSIYPDSLFIASCSSCCLKVLKETLFLLVWFSLENIPYICRLPKKEGSCSGSQLRYYYNLKRGSCQAFFYTGCGGSGNNFRRYEECLEVCEKRIGKKTTTTMEPPRGKKSISYPRGNILLSVLGSLGFYVVVLLFTIVVGKTKGTIQNWTSDDANPLSQPTVIAKSQLSLFAFTLEKGWWCMDMCQTLCANVGTGPDKFGLTLSWLV